MGKFNVAVTLPLTLFVTIEADNEEDAIEQARSIALDEPLDMWGNDESNMMLEIVE